MSANSLNAACEHYIRLCGGLAWRNNTGALYAGSDGERKRFVRFGVKGSGDVLGLLRGLFISVETKVKDKESDAQRQWREQVNECGGLALVVHSVDELAAALAERWPDLPRLQ